MFSLKEVFCEVLCKMIVNFYYFILQYEMEFILWDILFFFYVIMWNILVILLGEMYGRNFFNYCRCINVIMWIGGF